MFQSGVAHLQEVIFSENEALVTGGAVMVDSRSSLSVDRSTFVRNRAGRQGGALTFTGASNVTSTFNHFVLNDARWVRHLVPVVRRHHTVPSPCNAVASQCLHSVFTVRLFVRRLPPSYPSCLTLLLRPSFLVSPVVPPVPVAAWPARTPLG